MLHLDVPDGGLGRGGKELLVEVIQGLHVLLMHHQLGPVKPARWELDRYDRATMKERKGEHLAPV